MLIVIFSVFFEGWSTALKGGMLLFRFSMKFEDKRSVHLSKKKKKGYDYCQIVVTK